MALNVYHKVLQKLCEVTEGKSSKAVDFKNLVKQMGFHGNYADIFQRLSGEGWITETPKPDFVSITHWGVAEVKKATSAVPAAETSSEAKREAGKAAAASRELSGLLENFAQNPEKDKFPPIEKKFDELQNTISQIRKNLN
jgi:hypothetical protein